jgi:Tfp pilus assembly protein PilF
VHPRPGLGEKAGGKKSRRIFLLLEENQDTRQSMKKKGGQRVSAKQRKNKGAAKKKKEFSPAQLIAKAEECVENCQPDLASKFYKRALALQPSNTDIMDELSPILAELHCEDEAKQILLKSCELAPGVNPTKWMYLAQMQNGHEALASYEKGVAILQSEGAKAEAAGDTKEATDYAMHIRKQMCSTLVSMAELFMTDLCMEEIAEARCEELLKSALAFDSESPEPIQATANMRMSQHRVEEAGQLLDQTYAKLCACGA